VIALLTVSLNLFHLLLTLIEYIRNCNWKLKFLNLILSPPCFLCGIFVTGFAKTHLYHTFDILATKCCDCLLYTFSDSVTFCVKM